MLADCSGGGVVPPQAVPIQTATVDSSGTAQPSGNTASANRAAESVSTYGYINVTPVSLPAGALINAAAVYSNGGSQALSRSTALRLTTGTVTIVAVDTTYQGTTYAPKPANQQQTVYANRTTQVTISYSPLPKYGNLNVNIPGLPIGASANLTITGPNFGMTVFRAGVLSNLTPGTYVVSAQSITYGGKTYAPAAPTQNISVSANSTSTVTVTYAYTAPPPPPPASFSTQSMISAAQNLVQQVVAYAQGSDGKTHCNQFVNEFFRKVTGNYAPELANAGVALGVRDQLAGMVGSRRFKEITNPRDWNATYADAANRANTGQIVLAVTTYQDAHIAAVMPYGRTSGFGGYQVPLIAEATIRNRSSFCSGYNPSSKNGLDSAAPLSCGFYLSQQPNIRFFVFTP
jgi:hypothetical protein